MRSRVNRFCAAAILASIAVVGLIRAPADSSPIETDDPSPMTEAGPPSDEPVPSEEVEEAPESKPENFEPDDVSPAVWAGVAALLVAAAIWAVASNRAPDEINDPPATG